MIRAFGAHWVYPTVHAAPPSSIEKWGPTIAIDEADIRAQGQGLNEL